jgi:hypothetical protein
LGEEVECQIHLRDFLPEVMQTFSSRVGTACGHAGGKGNRIHRARAGRADRLDAQPTVLEQTIDHAPDESPMCSATLESEIHVLQWTGAHARKLRLERTKLHYTTIREKFPRVASLRSDREQDLYPRTGHRLELAGLSRRTWPVRSQIVGIVAIEQVLPDDNRLHSTSLGG